MLSVFLCLGYVSSAWQLPARIPASPCSTKADRSARMISSACSLASAFVPQAAQLSRATVQPSSSIVMGGRKLFRDGDFDAADVGRKARPLSYGSNCALPNP